MLWFFFLFFLVVGRMFGETEVSFENCNINFLKFYFHVIFRTMIIAKIYTLTKYSDEISKK